MTHQLPAWTTALRPVQEQAIADALRGLREGFKVCFLDAPTGVGKTLLADVVRQEMDTRGLYVCSGLQLQDQFHGDFPSYPVLKGKSNYPTVLEPEKSAAECLGNSCHMCPTMGLCPYRVAKEDARKADCAVLNTTYMLFEGNRTKSVFSDRGLVIADEADLLEDELMRFTELRVGRRLYADMGIAPPRDKVHYATIQNQLLEELIPALKARKKTIEKYAPSSWTIGELRRVDGALWAAGKAVLGLTDGNWIRERYTGGLLMKPIKVGGYAQQYLWSRGKQFLAMSGTIISAQQMAKDLGLEDHEWFSVTAPMSFPVENRPINLWPVADMKRANEGAHLPRLVDAIKQIMAEHPGERILIHSVSYELTKDLKDALKGNGRLVLSYLNRGDREKAIANYRRVKGSVLVAPSLDRGVDFKGDDCRVVIVAKVPFPNLGDPQVAAALHQDDGQQWYSVKTVRTIVQMTGRGVRSEDDHATSYILDRQFLRVWRQHKRLFPQWWRDAVNPAFRLNSKAS